MRFLFGVKTVPVGFVPVPVSVPVDVVVDVGAGVVCVWVDVAVDVGAGVVCVWVDVAVDVGAVPVEVVVAVGFGFGCAGTGVGAGVSAAGGVAGGVAWPGDGSLATVAAGGGSIGVADVSASGEAPPPRSAKIAVVMPPMSTNAPTPMSASGGPERAGARVGAAGAAGIAPGPP